MEKSASNGKARYIQGMFSDVCTGYDTASTAIAFKRDGSWRDYAASLVDGAGGRVLDVCCGTGALSWRLHKKTGRPIVAVDFCEGMIRQAVQKYGDNPEMIFGVADVQKLPFQDESFTCVTIAFALRNVEDIRISLSEITRVVRKGGRIIILDLGKPTSLPFRKIYYLYFYRLAPLIGGFLAKNGGYAYKYLPHSLTNFPAQTGLKKILEEMDLEDVKVYDLTRGVTAAYMASRPK